MLVEKDLTSLPIRVHSDGKDSITRTFDYSDLCAFLLLVLGVGDSHHDADFQDAVSNLTLLQLCTHTKGQNSKTWR